MAKLHLRIILHKEYKNGVCDIIAIQAAEMNGVLEPLPLYQYYETIEPQLRDNKDVKIYMEDETRMFVDVKAPNGEYYTGLLLEQVQIMELEAYHSFKKETFNINE